MMNSVLEGCIHNMWTCVGLLRQKHFHTQVTQPLIQLSSLLQTINIDGNNMDQVISTKFLGIYIDQHLTWAEHIKIISNKIAKNIGIIRKIAHLLPTKILI